MAIDFTASYPIVQWDLNQVSLQKYYIGSVDDNANGYKLMILQNGDVLTPTTEEVYFYFEKQDNTHGYIKATIDGSYFVISLTNQVFAAKGTVSSNFQITYNGKWKTSPEFIIKVDDNNIADSIESSNDFIAFQDALNRMGDLTTEVTTATTNANNAATNANEKATLADTAATNANTAADLANTKANLADEKATLANTATTNANTATANANNARYLGDYVSGTTYQISNIVKYNNALYICKAISTGNLPTNTTYWDMSSKQLAWLGAYDNSTTYNALDAVSYLGSSYICKQASTGNLPTNTTYFDPLASKGEKGATLSPKGSYNSGATYVKDDLVNYNESVWQCLQTSTGVTPAEGANWTIFLTGGGAIGDLGTLKTDIKTTAVDAINENHDKIVGLDTSIDTINSETTGSGVLSGLQVTAQSTPDMTVSVPTGVAYMPDGSRCTPTANTALAITTADTTNPRIDIAYVNSSKVISYLAGTAATTPTAPSLPSGGVLLAEINVAANATAITSAMITDKRTIIKSNTDLNGMVSENTTNIATKVSKGELVINVKDYGAIGNGESHPLSSKYTTLTDAQVVYPHVTSLDQEIDWAAIQKAINAGAYLRIFIPEGTYKISTTLVADNKHYMTIYGTSSTYIEMTTNLDALVIGHYVYTGTDNATSDNIQYRVNVRDIRFSCSYEGTKTNRGLDLRMASYGIYENIEFSNFEKGLEIRNGSDWNIFKGVEFYGTDYGFYFTGTGANNNYNATGNIISDCICGTSKAGFYMDQLYLGDMVISNCTFNTSDYGIYFKNIGGQTEGYLHKIGINHCDFDAAVKVPIHIEGGTGLLIADNNIGTYMQDGVYLKDCSNVLFDGNQIIQANTCITLETCSYCLITNNIMHRIFIEGIRLLNSPDNVISNNLFNALDTPAITSGIFFDGTLTVRNKITNNKFFLPTGIPEFKTNITNADNLIQDGNSEFIIPSDDTTFGEKTFFKRSISLTDAVNYLTLIQFKVPPYQAVVFEVLTCGIAQNAGASVYYTKQIALNNGSGCALTAIDNPNNQGIAIDIVIDVSDTTGIVIIKGRKGASGTEYDGNMTVKLLGCTNGYLSDKQQ